MERDYEMCWLNYKKDVIKDVIHDIKEIKEWMEDIVIIGKIYNFNSIKDEFEEFLSILGIKPKFHNNIIKKSKYILLGKYDDLKNLINMSIDENNLKDEGFIILVDKLLSSEILIITGKTLNSLIYGIYAFINKLRMGYKIRDIKMVESPKIKFRIINHWDNLDGSIERGYAGYSIFFRDNKILFNQRIKDYARLLSSIGINGIVLNNVNVRGEAIKLITSPYIEELARLADLFRNYGIRIFLSINFASPIYIGNLETADPLSTDVINWWKRIIKEIYNNIPDFGGFLVKADSEGIPGPYMYGRNHADGANMFARLLAPFNGYVFWRSFVYNLQDWRDTKTDRAKSAYENFKPLDGLFDDNVIIQIKYGPMDFQVREPISPLFGALEKTNQLLELQITQEYTGQQIHLCYLGTLWKEILDFDTYAKGEGSTVKRILEGKIFGRENYGFAGISNIGDSINWTGHDLAQANLWTFGKLAWNPDGDIKEIVKDWIILSLGNDNKIIENLLWMLLNSHSIYEKYTTPLGLGWMVNPVSHYGPNPEGYEYSKWGTYHRANFEAIGVDRTSKGTGYTLQYHQKWTEIFDDIEKCPENLLLFFHRIPYKYKLKSGKTLIQYIYDSHFEGVEEAEKLKEKWLELKDKIDDKIFQRVLERLNLQIEHAKEWRDVINTYFYRKTGIPDEKGRKIYP